MPSTVNQLRQILRAGGVKGLSVRVVRQLYSRLGAEQLSFPLLDGDVADPASLQLESPESRPERSRPMRIGWVTTPPGLGSGGHTTMFRMVEALERQGHHCRLFLYDRFGSDLRERERIIRTGWPTIRADVADARAGITGVDACVATGWSTAHALAVHGAEPMRRLYFIQDFEPMFYPRGYEYELAAATYRFGFRNIALGSMVSDLLRDEIGVASDLVPFGCDTDVYSLTTPAAARSGVVLYAKPDVPRRGYLLAQHALEEFHRRHPSQEIHAYGQRMSGLPYPVTWHGRLSPAELNDLYNRTVAGLAMSFTNISLVAEEMLAAGTVPVVNDSAMARADLDNEHVTWAAPTPGAVAQALSDLVSSPDIAARAARASATARRGWGETGDLVVRIVEDEVYG